MIDFSYRTFQTFNLNPALTGRIVFLVSRKKILSGRTAFDVDLARTLIDRKRTMSGPRYAPILHDLLEQFGYIDDGRHCDR